MFNTYLAVKAPREPTTNQFPQVIVYTKQIIQVSLTLAKTYSLYLFIFIFKYICIY